MNLRVHSIETFGTQEGPGIRLVVFFQGCNLRCSYCHNPDTQSVNREAEDFSVDQILEKLESQKSYFKDKGGLTVSGGEPTLQIDALFELFQKAKAKGFHTALDTNGYLYSDQIHDLYTYTDLLLLDIKHIDNEIHKQITGKGNTTILQNAEYREKQGKPMWLRYVLVPGVSDQENFLHQLGRHFQDYTQVERVEILPYHTLGVYKYAKLGLKYKLEKTKPPTFESIEKAKDIFDKYFKKVIVR